jgi:(p)ppGpp synthase/HD superfamily hydrolase
MNLFRKIRNEFTYNAYKYYYYFKLLFCYMFNASDYNLIRFRSFLEHLHIRQRYSGKYPYFYHLNMVGDMVRKFYLQCGFDNEDFIYLYKIAMLHDIIEDSHKYTYNDIVKEFGERVADGVYACTELRGRNRNERHGQEYYDTLLSNIDGHFVKLCDITANMLYGQKTKSSMFKKYLKELPKNKEKLGIDRFEIIFSYMKFQFQK